MIGGVTSSTAPAPLRDRMRSSAVLLNLAGVAVVAASVLQGGPRPADAVLAVLALVAWAAWTLVPAGRPRDLALLIGAPVAAAAAGLGATPLIAPALAALVVAGADLTHSPRAVTLFTGATALAVAVSASAHGMRLTDLLSLLAALAFGALGGISRRQRRVAEVRDEELRVRTLAAERETQRAELLEARSAAARDVHDVLAHSLGGLVLQLDAIEALLEHGRVEEARVRAADARRLAGEGLSEARRAVAALRDPDAAAPAAVPDDALERLLQEHRALGGVVEASGDLTLTGPDPAHREALVAALREALVNARRHAPGAGVRVRVDRTARAMVLRVENALPASPAPSPGGGHGLLGMRERFAALGDGSAASARIEDGRFVVEATAVLR